MNMAEHLSSDVGPSAPAVALRGVETLFDRKSNCAVNDGEMCASADFGVASNAVTGQFVTGQLKTVGGCENLVVETNTQAFFDDRASLVHRVMASPRAPKSGRRLFFAAAVATAFYGSLPALAGSLQNSAEASADAPTAASMGALNTTLSQAISPLPAASLAASSLAASSKPGAPGSRDAELQLPLLTAAEDVDDATRLLMAELSRMAMSQAASGRSAGAGLMWADVALSNESSFHSSLREAGFSSSKNVQPRFILTDSVYSNNEYSNQSAKSPKMSRSSLQLIAQETIAASSVSVSEKAAITKTETKAEIKAVATKTAVATNKTFAKNARAKSDARSASKAAQPTSMTLPPALPLVSQAENRGVAANVGAPTVLRGTKATPSRLGTKATPSRLGTKATPSRLGLKATPRLVSVSPLQSGAAASKNATTSTRSSTRSNANEGMKKVITVSSLKQLPPASQPLPLNYKGSRRASIIPIGADMPAAGSRAGNSSTTNSGVAALPSVPATPNSRPASRMSNQLEVATGTFVVLQTSTDLDTVAIANPEIADVAVVNSRAVLVNGKKPGITSLVIVDRDKIRQYQVRVVSAPGTLPRDIVAQIGLPGVSVRQVSDALVLDGEVENVEEARRATEIAGIYSRKVINNLTVRGVPTGDAAIAARLQGLIGYPNVTVNLVGDSVLLQGTVDSALQRAKAEQVAGITGKKVVNLIELPTLTVEEVLASLVSPASTLAPDARPQFGADTTNITVRREGDSIILEGIAIDQSRIDRAALLAARTGLQVINNIRLAPAPSADLEFSRRVETAIGIPTVRVSGSSKRAVLTGSVPDSNAANYAIQVTRSFAGEVDNMMTTKNPILINIDVSIVEINSNDAKRLGVQFGAVTLGPIIPGRPAIAAVDGTATLPGIAAVPATPDTRSVGTDFREGELLAGNYGFGGFRLLDGIRARLQALYSTGNARLLSNPRSTVLSGRTATFQVGGQVPNPSGSTTGQAGTSTTIIFKDFGILLEANPVGNNDGVVTMRVRTEVSQPDPTLGIIPPGGGGLIPGFSRRQTVTEVVVGRGGTVALGGLIQNNVTQSISRIPLLSKIPILGELFKSKSFQRNQTELVIFMTPRVLPNTLPEGADAFTGVSISDNTTNIGTQLGNPGITTFSSGSSIASGGGQ